MKITIEYVKEWMEVNTPDFTLLSTEYVSAKSKLFIRCDKGHEFTISWDKFKVRKRCTKCSRLRAGARTKPSYKCVREEFENCGYILLDTEYINSHTPMRYLCPTHGEQKITLNSLRSGSRCKFCHYDLLAESQRMPYNTVKDAFSKAGYILLSKDYRNAHQKLKYLCPIHGEQETTYDNIKSGCRCPQCNVSKGEQKIQQWLDNKNITYATQYTFSDLKYINSLKFDFCIFKPNGKTIKCLIEYQGEQHYEPVDWASKGEQWAEEKFRENQARDKLKVDYCKLHNIPLLLISYEEFSYLEDILDKYLGGGDYA